MALTREERGSHRRINTAGHGYDDTHVIQMIQTRSGPRRCGAIRAVTAAFR
jgi:hypothetical protein